MTTLNDLGNGLYERNDHASLLGMHLGHRMTVVVLPAQSGGGLWIHSPVAWSQELWDELEALVPEGAPKHLVIPSRTHDLHLKPWMERIPAETTYAPEALQEAHKDWSVGHTLTEDFRASWSDDFEHTLLDGAPRVSEVAFFHRPSKTLVLVDSVFNLSGEGTFLGKLFLKLDRCYKGIKMSLMFRMMTKDKAAMGKSLERVLAWDFERVVLGHGKTIEGADLAELRSLLANP